MGKNPYFSAIPFLTSAVNQLNFEMFFQSSENENSKNLQSSLILLPSWQ